MFFFLAVIPAGKRASPCSSNHPDAKRTRLAGTDSNNCSCMECGLAHYPAAMMLPFMKEFKLGFVMLGSLSFQP